MQGSSCSFWQNNDDNCPMVKEDLVYCPNVDKSSTVDKSSIHILLPHKDDEKHSLYLLYINVTHRFVCALPPVMGGNKQNSQGL